MPPFKRPTDNGNHDSCPKRPTNDNFATFSNRRTKNSIPPDRYGNKLSIPQLRVLLVLSKSHGPLSRVKLSQRTGNKTMVMVGRALGYDDPEKRRRFEQTVDGGHRPSLQTLGYVRKYVLDIDGQEELAYEITERGRHCIEDIGDIELPEIHDSYEIMRQQGRQRNYNPSTDKEDSSTDDQPQPTQ